MQTQTQREARVEKLAIDIGLAEGADVNIVATERAPNIDALLSRSAAWQLGLGCLPVFANSLAYERPVVRLLPPLIVSEAKIGEAIARLDRAATALEKAQVAQEATG